MKTIRCKHREGPLVVKKFIKPDQTVSLQQIAKAMMAERDALQSVANAFPYERIMETDTAGYLIRQFLFSNLYDRISTRPFLALPEKKWIAFQVLTGLMEAHARQIYHGDIKTENILVTSWNWAYLSDFSGFKPTYLPEDNPADFSFFFDTSSRRSCYVAPERFLAPGETLFSEKGTGLTPAMDVFSLGCTLAELFLEGMPILSFSQLLRYRKDEYDPTSQLDKIEDPHIKDMIKEMIQIDPAKRGTAASHWSKWRGLAFPEHYYSFLHSFVAGLSDLSGSIVSSHIVSIQGNPTAVYADADAKIDRIYADFYLIAAAVGIPNDFVHGSGAGGSRLSVGPAGLPAVAASSSFDDPGTPVEASDTWETKGKKRLDSTTTGTARKATLFPFHLNIPSYAMSTDLIRKNSSCHDACLILTSIVCSSIRNTFHPRSRIMALELLLALGIQLEDEYRLDRVVPFVVSLFKDESANVRATALRVLTQLLTMVDSITTAESNIFPEYIFPSLHRFASDPEIFVRSIYAQCITPLAEASARFLELAQLLRSGLPSDPDSVGDSALMSYDSCLRDLHDLVQEEVVSLLSDSDPHVKRSLLADIPRLCIFFGRHRANDVLLGHTITYLNDQDWQLRSAFFESIVGVGTFVGSRSLEEYILPLTIQALTDAEEFVVEKVLASLTSIAELGLLQKQKLKEFAATIMPLLCHPNVWIRNGAISFIACATKLMPLIDVRCVIYPMIKPFLRADIPEITEVYLLENLKKPVSRNLYDQTLAFLAKTPPTLGRGDGRDGIDWSFDSDASGSSSSPRKGDSTDLIRRLREFGMTDEDKEKLFALKYYIFKSSQSRLRRLPSESANLDAKIQDLTERLPGSSSPALSRLSFRANLSRLPLNDKRPFQIPPAALKPMYGAEPKPYNPPLSPDMRSSSSFSDTATERRVSRPSINPSESSRPYTQSDTDSQSGAGMGGGSVAGGGGGWAGGGTSTKRSSRDHSHFSLDLVGGDKKQLGASPPTIAVSSETAVATLEQRVSSPIALRGDAIIKGVGPSSRSSSPSIAAAVIAAAAAGSWKSAAASLGGAGRHGNDLSPAGALGGGGAGGGSGGGGGGGGNPLSYSPDRRLGSPLKRSSISSGTTFSLDPKPRVPPSQTGSLIGLPSIGAEGRDKYIRKLLEAKTMELFPPPLTEFGPKVHGPPVSSGLSPRGRKGRHSTTYNDGDLRSWRPDGVLAAHLTEHRGAVNQIKLSPDHNFFVSCSDDGSFKVWDCQRMEKNVTNRARLTYAQQGGKLLSVAFCERSHSVASVSDNGSIHVSRIEYISSATQNGSAKYNGVHTIRTSEADDRDWPVVVDHYEKEQDSILVYATAHGKFRGLDLRSMKTAWSFDSPASHGVITSFAMDPRHAWALTGTSRGVFSLWDVRFGLRVKSWAHPWRSRVHRVVAGAGSLARYNGSGIGGGGGGGGLSTKMVMASVGTRTSEVSLWDMESGECREVWCVFGDAGAGRSAVVGGGDPAEEMNKLYGSGLKPLPPPTMTDFMPLGDFATYAAWSSSSSSPTESSTRSFVAPANAPYLLTAGSDRRIRFWDLANIDASYVVSGMESTDVAPRYSTHRYGDVNFNIEYTPSLAFASSSSSSQSPPRSSGVVSAGGIIGGSGGGIVGVGGSTAAALASAASAAGVGMGGAGLPSASSSSLSSLASVSSSSSSASSSSTSSSSSSALGGAASSAVASSGLVSSPSVINHLDAINDLVVTQVPYPMIVAGGRDGIIKVWI
ncbi:hypothetical protein DFJ73DRAFT_451681 [Zopfochytrium polystomum]|nr:hypothetical protein DFJ73DRAFT_451681 [Zopfochytrium polystomum]